MIPEIKHSFLKGREALKNLNASIDVFFNELTEICMELSQLSGHDVKFEVSGPNSSCIEIYVVKTYYGEPKSLTEELFYLSLPIRGGVYPLTMVRPVERVANSSSEIMNIMCECLEFVETANKLQ